MLAFLLFACVSRGHHEVVVMQLDATRTALSAQQSMTRDELAARDAEIVRLDDEIHARQTQLDLLDEKHAAHDADLEALRTKYAALLAEAAAQTAPPDPKVPKPKVPLTPLAPQRPVLTASIEEMVAALEVSSAAAFEARRAEERHARVLTAFDKLVGEGFAVVERRGNSSVVIILAAKLFNENTVALSPRGEAIAHEVWVAMSTLHGWDMEIQGHTDATPFHSPELPSNWELGFARGVALFRALRDLGVDETAHVSSFADTVPRVPLTDPEASRTNARVELWLSEMPGVETQFSPTPAP